MTDEGDSGPEEIGRELAGDAQAAAIVPPVTPDGQNIDLLDSGPVGWRGYLRALGPGLVTGASDDDPSGIATYAQTGAQFGFAMLWAALITFPLMAGVQEICDRTALATGKGLGELLVVRFGRAWRVVIGLLIGALIIANALNIAADLVAIGAGMHLLHAGPAVLWAVLAGVIIMVLLVSGSFATIARVFKVLCAALLAYVAELFFVKIPWGTVFFNTVVPHIRFSRTYIALLVGVLGTTISPYLFFWQSMHRIEDMREEDAGGTRPLPLRRRSRIDAARKESRSRFDVFRDRGGLTSCALSSWSLRSVAEPRYDGRCACLERWNRGSPYSSAHCAGRGAASRLSCALCRRDLRRGPGYRCQCVLISSRVMYREVDELRDAAKSRSNLVINGRQLNLMGFSPRSVP